MPQDIKGVQVRGDWAVRRDQIALKKSKKKKKSPCVRPRLDQLPCRHLTQEGCKVQPFLPNFTAGLLKAGAEGN